MSAWGEYVLPKSEVNRDALVNVRKWLSEGVDVIKFSTHFIGNFRGKPHNSDWSSNAILSNSLICKKYDAFISEVMYKNIRSGVIRMPGKIGIILWCL